VVGGGKFSNGAQTGAFRYLFNESMHDDNAYVSGYKCTGNCHGVDYSDIKFMSVEEQENLAKDVALGLVTLPIGGGAALHLGRLCYYLLRCRLQSKSRRKRLLFVLIGRMKS
jgi:hypothetical protein